jgi:hypothetical protein
MSGAAAAALAVGDELADRTAGLLAWVAGALSEGGAALPGEAVRFCAMGAPRAGELPDRAVLVSLLGLRSQPAQREQRSTPLQFQARYLIAPVGPADDQQRLLGELAFAALANAELSVELEPPPLEVWPALGLAPRPAFTVGLAVQRRRLRTITRVQHRPEPRLVNMAAFRGRVLGPQGTPLAGAQIELPSLQLMTVADHQGRFVFPSVPAEPRTLTFVVQAKGQIESVVAERSVDPDAFAPLVFPELRKEE